MAVAALTPERALRQPRRVDARALVGLFLLLLAFAGSLAFWTATSDTRTAVVAARDLPAGATLAPGDLTVARVRLDDDLYAAAVPGDALAGLVGKQLAFPAHAHQLLVQAQLSTRPALGPDQVALTIPVSAPSAVGGRIKPGDSVRVYATTEKGKAESRTTVVLERATVLEVGYDQRAPVVGAAGGEATDRSTRGAPSWVTMLLTSEQGAILSHARHNAELDLALLGAER